MRDEEACESQCCDDPEAEAASLGIPKPIPLPHFPPFRLPVSGLYERPRRPIILPPVPVPIPRVPPIGPEIPDPGPLPGLGIGWRGGEQLRLDVDGYWPQMQASGTLGASLASQVNWVARLTSTGADSWKGTIWYREGATAGFPHTEVAIQVTGGWLATSRTATATFTGGGGSPLVLAFPYKSRYFHRLDFEYDFAEGVTPVTIIDTCAHPNRPPALPCETLSIETIYRRTGFDVTISTPSPVPLSLAGANARWSDLEMHDAMLAYWSHFANAPQWAMWVLFASLHEMGTSLGGIMFDDIGPNHRQGTSLFLDSFIAKAPAGDPNPAAWVARMRFWTAVHEMGHAVNLAHSWQKALGTPWIPLANEPEARSFMNYPYYVSGGATAFFASFEYRFSNGELLFLRHAPARFVQPGNASWFDHHGFQEANVSPEPALELDLRLNRETAVFEFMEPVGMELKLTNVSAQPQLVDAKVLSKSGAMTIVVKRDGQPAREFTPFGQYCLQPAAVALMPSEALYESLCLSAGVNGWDVAEPGHYTVQVALHLGDEDIVSRPLRLRVTPPAGYEEERLAQDVFSEDVGRILAFHGSRFLSGGNDILREVREKLSGRRVALHASLALGEGLARPAKELEAGPKAEGRGLRLRLDAAQPEEARELLGAALTTQPALAAETLGNITFRRRVNRLGEWLAAEGAPEAAFEAQDALYQTLSVREVRGRPVLPAVLDEIKACRDGYAAKKRKS